MEQDKFENAIDQNHEIEKLVETKKKNKSNRKIFVMSISIFFVALFLLYSYIGSLITHVIDVKENFDAVIETIVFDEENIPNTFLEKYKFYKEFKSPNKWDYSKYTAPVLENVKNNITNKCDSYHVNAPSIINFNNFSLRCYNDIYVDGKVAHGTINVEFFDYDVVEFDSKNGNTGLYYESDVEFYRILEDDKITTYISTNGKDWFKKEGMLINNNHVLFDLKTFIENIDAKESSFFPTYYTDENGKYIAIDVMFKPYNDMFIDDGFLYYECDDYGKVTMTIREDNYLPEKIFSMMAKVDKDKLLKKFNLGNDRVLEKLCESEIEIWPIYNFDQYNEVEVELPDELLNAKIVNDFSELFSDLYDVINKYSSELK